MTSEKSINCQNSMASIQFEICDSPGKRNRLSEPLEHLEDITNQGVTTDHQNGTTEVSINPFEEKGKPRRNRTIFNENRNKLEAFFKGKSQSKEVTVVQATPASKSKANTAALVAAINMPLPPPPPKITVVPSPSLLAPPPAIPLLQPIALVSLTDKIKVAEIKMSMSLKNMQIIGQAFIHPINSHRSNFLARRDPIPTLLDQDYQKYLIKFQKAEDDFFSSQKEFNLLSEQLK